ncbi:2-dehydropantoate 2-reductase [Streptomyces sp. HNM0574]|nr:2-dehydropantoate 2-reductase [Streptomyces sp. HNM0574]
MIGGGAVGGLLAVLLHRADHRVTLCLRTPVDRLTLRTGGEEAEVPVRLATAPAEVGPVDWVFLTTKAQDTAGAAGWLRALTGPGTVVAVVQNGVDHRERVAPLLPPDARVLPALAYTAVERVAPGRIVHHAASELHVPRGEFARALEELLDGSGVTVKAVDDFRTAVWEKLFTNLVANPLTTLLQQRLGVLTHPEMRRLGEDILREALAVARADGAANDERHIRRTMNRFRHVPPTGGTSMLYDRAAGRPLEHEHITGAVVRAGERHGIATPLNSMLLTLLRAVDRELRGEPAGAQEAE